MDLSCRPPGSLTEKKDREHNNMTKAHTHHRGLRRPEKEESAAYHAAWRKVLGNWDKCEVLSPFTDELKLLARRRCPTISLLSPKVLLRLIELWHEIRFFFAAVLQEACKGDDYLAFFAVMENLYAILGRAAVHHGLDEEALGDDYYWHVVMPQLEFAETQDKITPNVGFALSYASASIIAEEQGSKRVVEKTMAFLASVDVKRRRNWLKAIRADQNKRHTGIDEASERADLLVTRLAKRCRLKAETTEQAVETPSTEPYHERPPGVRRAQSEVANTRPLLPAPDSRSMPVSEAELARRILGKDSARPRDARPIIKEHAPLKVGNKWTIRLDPELGKETIARLQKPPP
jgi:hypothetical protein